MIPKNSRADGLKTLNECVDEYLVYISGVQMLSENTLVSYKNDLAQFLKMPSIDKDSPVVLIESENLRDCIGFLSKKKRSAASINRFLATIRSLFAYCRRLGYIRVNPAQEIRSVKVPKKLPRFMTQKEVDELCAQPSKNEILWEKRDSALFEMMYSSGCRVSEIAKIKLSDLSEDFSQAIVFGTTRKML